MKNTKCRVISEFKGEIAGYTINDHDTYYMIKLAIELITDKLRRVKIKKQKDFVKDIVVGLLGLKNSRTHTADRHIKCSVNSITKI